MKPIIVTTSPGFGTAGKLPDFLSKKDWNLIRCIDKNQPDGGVSQYADSMEFLVVGLIPATKKTIQSTPRLKAVIKHGVGTDNIDIHAATARKIPVLNTPGANSNAVAELALGGMFSLARHIPMVHKTIVDGGWDRYIGTELEGKTLGIVGLGNIGKILARKARALGMKVMASDLYPDHEFAKRENIDFADLDTLLREADYLSLHVFGGKDNAHLIGRRELEMMKTGACVMNYARGEVLDLDALAQALDDNKIFGAAIDAYSVEPPDRSHPIFKSPKVVFTPHSGADSKESVERMGMMVLAEIEAIMDGKKPARIVNPEIYQ